MANMQKCYFLCPTWDYHPEDGPIQLGNLISNAKWPDSLPNPKLPGSVDSFPPTTQTGVTWIKEKFQSGCYGLWAAFISALAGVSATAAYENSSRIDQVFVFDSLQTREFLPSADFVRERLGANHAALEYLRTCRLRKHVYMITGVKIAYGARAKTAAGGSHGGRLQAQVDGTLTGVPLDVGPQIQTDHSRNETVAFRGSSPFVFAYRLRKIIVHHSGEITQAEHTSGALYSTGQRKQQQEYPFKVDGLSVEDASADDFPGLSFGPIALGNEEEMRYVEAYQVER